MEIHPSNAQKTDLSAIIEMESAFKRNAKLFLNHFPLSLK